MDGQGRELLDLATNEGASWSARREAIAALVRLRNPEGLRGRIAAVDYCAPPLATTSATGEVGPVWQFWAQGWEGAPPIVRSCVESVRANTSGRQHVLLSVDTLKDYLDFSPEAVARFQFWSWTKVANLVRLMLLEKYGGTWIDATVFLAAPLPRYVEDSPLFVFRRNDFRLLANWFMHSVQGHPLISACRVAYERYWMTTKERQSYFMFHFIVEAVVLSSRSLLQMWEEIPERPVPRELQDALDEPFDAERLREIFARSLIQKLSYKDEPLPSDGPLTFRQYIIGLERLSLAQG
ncbi:MAG: capsular polysaccharide synthesis protein [Devosia sp.]